MTKAFNMSYLTRNSHFVDFPSLESGKHHVRFLETVTSSLLQLA